MMRRVIFLAGLVLALVTVAVFLPGSARSAAGGTNLPMKGSYTGQLSINMSTGELHTWTAGPATHLGWRTAESVGYAIPDGSGGFNIFATFTGTAANGDQVSGTLTNNLLVFTSGTGRFEGATGYVTQIVETTNVVIAGGYMTADMAGTVDGVLNLNRP